MPVADGYLSDDGSVPEEAHAQLPSVDSDGDAFDLDPTLHSGWMFVHDSDSEPEVDEATLGTSDEHKRIRAVADRAEYRELSELGLTVRPAGCSIGVHPGGFVWRACASGGAHHGRSFGPKSGRSAKQALLAVIQCTLVDHTNVNPKDRLAKNQLSKVREAIAAEPPHKN